MVAGDVDRSCCRPIYRARRPVVATATGGRPVPSAAIISIVDDDESVRAAMSSLDLQDVLLARKQVLPIIFITAFPADSLRQRAEAAGAAGFFSKPVDSQMIR